MRELDSPVLSDEKLAGDIDSVRKQKDSEGKDTAFDRLVLEKGHKDMIVSLITQHFRDKEIKGAQMEQVDIVRGKGLVFFHKVKTFIEKLFH